MAALRLLVAVGAVATAHGALELDMDNWDGALAGKSAFVKFLAPWWGHCKSMKPDWDKLAEEFADSQKVVIADVDCTASGKALCEKYGVQGCERRTAPCL
jgi:thiol-disulfide isomerase/thioredoxin